MTREEAIELLEDLDGAIEDNQGRDYDEAFRMAIEALKVKTNGDTISRADAMGAVQDHFNADGFKGYCDGQQMMDRIKALPSAEARPTGEWKPKNHHTDYCSNCGFEETQWRTADYNFCPSCGAIMKGVDDEHTV